MSEATVISGLGWPGSSGKVVSEDQPGRVVAGLGWPTGQSCEEHGVSRETGTRAACSESEKG